MKRSMITISLMLVATQAGAGGGVQFELLQGMYPLDMSSDGSVIVGNNIVYETVRWTRETGIANLGRGTWVRLGVGAGTPDVSDDGTRVSATIITDDGSFATQGIWTEGLGWVDMMPPTPPDGGLIDLSYGSAWGLSGDGETLVGLYWRPGNFGTGGAHASMTTMPGGVTDIGTNNGNSRANDANYDASVIVGWEERFDGVWEPVVWENGVMSRLGNSNVFSMAECVNTDGTIIGGNITTDINSNFAFAQASIWRKDGSGWAHEFIGSLPGTVAPFGLSTVRDMTPDGSIVVGYNQTNLQSVTGFIWTPDDGIMDIEDWLIARGITIPNNLNILDVTAISDDGKIIAGIGASTIDGSPIGFLITPECVADIDGNGTLDFFDVSAFLSAFNTQDPSADLNGDGSFNFFDISAFLGAYNSGCP